MQTSQNEIRTSLIVYGEVYGEYTKTDGENMLKSITAKLSTHTQSIWHREYYISVDAPNWTKGVSRGEVGSAVRKGCDSVPRVAVAATPGIVVLMKCKQTSKECWL